MGKVLSAESTSPCSSAMPRPREGGLEEQVLATDLVQCDPSLLMLPCTGSLERCEEEVGECMGFDVEAPFFVSCKRAAVSGTLSISCHLSELQAGAGVIESTAFSGLSKRLASGSILSVRRRTSRASVTEALESSSPSRKTGSITRSQKNWPPISTREVNRTPPPPKLAPQFRFSYLGRDPPL
ncbi:hypothetical protein N431DRAFT_17148 [Stipitochalara longipes BDJ]|nr:hypothetical protein N431DRAFT_17148 [Stipitochalara longipes BDJ]